MALAALQTGKRGPSVVVNDPGYFNFGGHRFGSPEGNLGGVDMRRSIQLSSNIYYYSLANEMGVDLIHDFDEAAGLRPDHRHRHRRRGARRAAQHRVEAQRLQAARAEEVVRRRDHLAGHRPGLQHLHDAAAGAGHGHRGRTAACKHKPHLVLAIARHGDGQGQAGRAAAGREPRLHAAPTSAVVRDGLVARDHRRHGARRVRRRGLPGGRQDRHRAGGDAWRRTPSTTPRRSKSTSATTRCSWPSRRPTTRRSRWR